MRALDAANDGLPMLGGLAKDVWLRFEERESGDGIQREWMEDTSTKARERGKEGGRSERGAEVRELEDGRRDEAQKNRKSRENLWLGLGWATANGVSSSATSDCVGWSPTQNLTSKDPYKSIDSTPYQFCHDSPPGTAPQQRSISDPFPCPVISLCSRKRQLMSVRYVMEEQVMVSVPRLNCPCLTVHQQRVRVPNPAN